MQKNKRKSVSEISLTNLFNREISIIGENKRLELLDQLKKKIQINRGQLIEANKYIRNNDIPNSFSFKFSESSFIKSKNSISDSVSPNHKSEQTLSQYQSIFEKKVNKNPTQMTDPYVEEINKQNSLKIIKNPHWGIQKPFNYRDSISLPSMLSDINSKSPELNSINLKNSILNSRPGSIKKQSSHITLKYNKIGEDRYYLGAGYLNHKPSAASVLDSFQLDVSNSEPQIVEEQTQIKFHRPSLNSIYKNMEQKFRIFPKISSTCSIDLINKNIGKMKKEQLNQTKNKEFVGDNSNQGLITDKILKHKDEPLNYTHKRNQSEIITYFQRTSQKGSITCQFLETDKTMNTQIITSDLDRNRSIDFQEIIQIPENVNYITEFEPDALLRVQSGFRSNDSIRLPKLTFDDTLIEQNTRMERLQGENQVFKQLNQELKPIHMHENLLVEAIANQYQSDEAFRRTYNIYFEMDFEQYSFHLRKFLVFVLGIIREDQVKEGTFSQIKMGFQILDQLEAILINQLREISTPQNVTQIFQKSFREKSRKFLVPESLLEDIGGHSKLMFYSSEIAQRLRMQYPALTQRIELEQEIFQIGYSILHRNYQRAQMIINQSIKNNEITFVQFFIVQKAILKVFDKATSVKNSVKLEILEIYENIRYIMMPELYYLEEKNIEMIQDDMLISKTLTRYFKEPRDQMAKEFLVGFLNSAFNSSTLREFIHTANQQWLQYQIDRNFIYIFKMTLTNEQNVPNSHFRLEIFIKDLSIQFDSCLRFIENNYDNQQGKNKLSFFDTFKLHSISSFVQIVEDSIDQYFAGNPDYRSQYPEISQKNVLDYKYLKCLLALTLNSEHEIFSFYDIAAAYSYFNLKQSTIKFHLEFLYQTLLKNNHDQFEISRLQVYLEQRLFFN